MELQFSIQGTGQSVIFLPGLFAGGWIWDKIATNLLNHGYQVISYKDAIPVIFGNRYKQAERALLSVIEQCDTKPILIGNSMGALIALEFTRNHPEKVHQLIMSGSPGLFEVETGIPQEDLRTGDEKYAAMLIDKVFYDKSAIPPTAVQTVAELFSDANNCSSMLKWLLFSRNYNVPDAILNIQEKIALIWGQHDEITPVSAWQQLSEQENIWMKIVQNAGHSPMLELPTEFTHHLLNAIQLSEQFDLASA